MVFNAVKLPDWFWEEVAEREAIFEFDAGLDRGEAHTRAYWLVYKKIDPMNRTYEDIVARVK